MFFTVAIQVIKTLFECIHQVHAHCSKEEDNNMTYQCDRISDLSMCQNKEGGSIYQVRKWKIETCHFVEIQMA